MDDAPMETADNRPQQDQINRLEEMATFVNNRVFELVTTKMHDDEKVVTPKDVVAAVDMKDCMNANTKTVIEAELRGDSR
ncbi:unnamed protein product [Peronospora belbahrii]|uniref:Transcription factor CBF/NF-Y/archaeal histone domain-containing protein n=1 Tax=Peronospora belbahrii TaxID=622444 RepID=A0AAU9KN40_9STRA|nr:unnamed protein product [Peronospora belbahrii]